MKLVTYLPRSIVSADMLSLSVPDVGSVLLLKEIPTMVEDKAIEWLQSNDPEFKACVEQHIIVVESADPSKATPVPVDAGSENKTPVPPADTVTTTVPTASKNVPATSATPKTVK